MNLMRSVSRLTMLCTVGFRFVCSLFMLGGFVVSHVMGETLTLQLPFSRATHTFTLRELHPSGTPGNGWPNLGYPAGYYLSHPVDQMELVGGDFDFNGVWQPGPAPMVQGLVNRIGTGLYFIVDETTSEASRPNLVALAGSDPWSWSSLNSSLYGMYFSIEAARFDHVFALQAQGGGTGSFWSGWFPLSKIEPPVWWTADGSSSTLGFFEAWAFLPGSPGSWSLVDLTGAQYGSGTKDTVGPVTFSTPFNQNNGPIYQARIRVPYQSQTFDVISPYGSTQSVTANIPHGDGLTWDVVVSVGAGREFWLERTSPPDHKVSPIFRMEMDDLDQDATVAFAEFDWVDQQIQTLTFRVGTHLDPSTLRFRRTNDWTHPMPLSVSPTTSSVTLLYPDGAQEIVYFKTCTITADVAGGWAITDASGNSLGTGPDFINWPEHTAQYMSVAIPATRIAHSLQTDFGAGLVSNSYPQTYSVHDVWTGESYDFQYVWLDVMVPYSGNDFSLSDLTTGEVSATLSNHANQQMSDLMEWHPTIPKTLKISATRWNHTLLIYCADGTVAPLTKQQVQGDWSLDPIGQQGWFNSYGFFDATTLIKEGIPWHLYDVTRAQYLSPALGDSNNFIDATDNTDTDGDGLPDWYESMIGTKPNAVDTDGDGVNDKAELIAGTNPRAASVASLPTATLQVYTLLK